MQQSGNVNSENIRKIELPLPPLSIQKEVAERLLEEYDVVTTIVDCQAVRFAEVDQLMNAVLRKAFTGEL